MKKVLVTGASGFLGDHIIPVLLKMDYEVIATSKNENKAKKLKWIDSVHYIQFDYNDSEPQDNLFELFQKPDLMIHLAWQGLPNYNELFHFEKNLPANYLFIKNLIENGLKKISIAGTCLEYGMKEGCLDETIDAAPDNPYALAKDTLRKFIQELNKKIDFDYNWIRLFYVYGRGQGKNSIISQLEDAIDKKEKYFNMSGGEQVRDYLKVEMVAEYITKISVQNKFNGLFNCCSGKPISIKDFVEDYLKRKKSNICLNLGYYPYNDYEPMSFWGNNKNLKKILSLFEKT